MCWGLEGLQQSRRLGLGREAPASLRLFLPHRSTSTARAGIGVGASRVSSGKMACQSSPKSDCDLDLLLEESGEDWTHLLPSADMLECFVYHYCVRRHDGRDDVDLIDVTPGRQLFFEVMPLELLNLVVGASKGIAIHTLIALYRSNRSLTL